MKDQEMYEIIKKIFDEKEYYHIKSINASFKLYKFSLNQLKLIKKLVTVTITDEFRLNDNQGIDSNYLESIIIFSKLIEDEINKKISRIIEIIFCSAALVALIKWFIIFNNTVKSW